MSEILPPQEWPYLLNVEEVGQKPLNLTISPTAEQYKALARRLGLMDLPRFEAKLIITRHKGNMLIHVRGKFEAKVTQRCIISLRPVEEEVSEEFEGWYADNNQAVSFAKAKRERMSPQELIEQPLLEENEDPEPIIDGKIDLGELVTQYLSLSLNPYPRTQGIDYENKILPREAEPEGMYDNPFAALKEWKMKEGKKD